MLLSELGSDVGILESKFKETDLTISSGVKSISGNRSFLSIVSDENTVELYWEEKLLPGGKFIDASLE